MKWFSTNVFQALSLYHIGRLDQAIVLFETVRSSVSGSPEYLRVLAQALKDIGMFDCYNPKEHDEIFQVIAHFLFECILP